ncbi:hypothetical protein IE53DRAFT_389239 [Violaceomyces palustris]|uniref:Uncharacterized protein n=1 Tax=Violaceomyces palustris TaxID=1673888 RepID=A0ACD0NRT3_9BASI|nr:hypothetical protein IE53DRAFT_389239 [Violaceomyces palustris]
MALIIFHLPALVLNHSASLLYPLYASYKAITAQSRKSSTVSDYSWNLNDRQDARDQDPSSKSDSTTTELAEMETWLIYWSIFACINLAESYFGWSWRWVPFYYELRLFFNLWLVLPQTRGANYLYINHLYPLLHSHQNTIDSALSQIKSSASSQIATAIESAWKLARSYAFGEASYPTPEPTPPSTGQTGAVPPPSMHNPIQAPSTQLGRLFDRMAPFAAAGAAALLEKARTSQAQTANPPGSSSSASDTFASRPGSKAQAMARRAELERQLAQLDASSFSVSSEGEGDDKAASKSSPSLQVPGLNLGVGGRRSVSASASTSDSSGGENDPGSNRARRRTGNLSDSYDMLDKVDFSPNAKAGFAAAARGGTAPGTTDEDARGGWFRRG